MRKLFNVFDLASVQPKVFGSARTMRFADGASEGAATPGAAATVGAATGEASPTTGDTVATPPATTEPPATARTFTQEEVTRMMAAEKAQGRNAALNELGVTDVAAAKALLDAAKPPETRQAEHEAATATAIAEAIARAEAAEQKLVLTKAHANDATLDDVLLLAKARVNETTTFEQAVEAVKANFPTMFGAAGNSGTGSSGTGAPAGGTGVTGTNGAGSYGERAAQVAQQSRASTKSSFFTTN